MTVRLPYDLLVSLTIHPLSPFGAEIITTADELLHDPAAAEQVNAALAEHSVLLFRGLHLDDATQLALGDRLGTVVGKHSPGWSKWFPGIYRVALDPEANGELYMKRSWDWHIDGVTTNGNPPRATMLSCHTATQPGEGGETELVSTYIAYDRLTDAEKARCETLKVWHGVEPSRYTAPLNLTQADLERLAAEPRQLQPLVWTHENGRKSLVLGITALSVDGMPADESAALLQDLLDRATAAEIVLQHVWSVGDVVMWDNTGTMHRGRPFTSESGRDMHRFTLAGHESIR